MSYEPMIDWHVVLRSAELTIASRTAIQRSDRLIEMMDQTLVRNMVSSDGVAAGEGRGEESGELRCRRPVADNEK